MANLIQLSPQYFPKSSVGTPVGAGSVYIGTPDTDPTITANQKAVTALQENGSFVAMSQPITLSAGGIPLYNGSPVSIYTSGNYSMTVLDINDAQIYYIPFNPPAGAQGNYYYPDYTETDQGVAGEGSTIKAYVDTIGTTNKATLFFAHNSGNEFTTYTLTTSETIPSNITLIFERGAIIDGAGTLTIEGSLEASTSDKIFGSSVTIDFGPGGVDLVYPEWWGAKPDDDTVDSAAPINSAISSLPQQSPAWNGTNLSGMTEASGGTVRFSGGIYYCTSTFLDFKPFINYEGSNWRTTVLQVTYVDATDHYSVKCEGARWSTIKNLTIKGTDNTAQTGLYISSDGDQFAGRLNIENVALYSFYNAVTIATSCTSSTFENMRIRGQDGVSNAAFNFVGATFSTCTFDSIYISQCDYGILGDVNTTIGNCTFNNIIAEGSDEAGVKVHAMSRCTWTSCYIGDANKNYAFHLTDSWNNTWTETFVNSSGGTDVFYMDGSFDNNLGHVFIQGAFTGYVVNMQNVTSLAEQAPNEISFRVTASEPILGVTNNWGAVRVLQTPETMTSTGFPNLSYLYRYRQMTIDRWTWGCADDPASKFMWHTDITDQSRWSFMRTRPGQDAYSFMAHEDGQTMGVLPVAGESLGADQIALITPDANDSTFESDAAPWAWLEDQVTVTRGTGGAGGSDYYMKVTTDVGANSSANVKIQFSALTIGKLYKIEWYQKFEGQQFYFNLFKGVSSDVIGRTSAGPNPADTSTWLYRSMYFVSEAVNDYIYIYVYVVAEGGSFGIDNITCKEVESASSLQLTGGRKYDDGTNYGSGGGIKLVGSEAAADPGSIQFQTPATPGTAYGTMKMFCYQADALADDGTLNLPDATSGMCFVSCNAEAGMWLVQNDGTCTKISGSANTADTDSDTDLCVYDGGTNGIVKNRLGASGEIRVFYYYN